MLWIKALHVIFMVAWFAGLFYLPRLFVYHAMSDDAISLARFKVMEYKLFYIITTPAGLLTTAFGLWLMSDSWQGYGQMAWMHAKLACVVLLWCYHLYCGYLVYVFAHDNNRFTPRFYRWFNEVPTLLLFLIVIFAVVKPL